MRVFSETAAGYAHLLARYGVEAPLPAHTSCIRADGGPRRSRARMGGVEESFPRSFDPGAHDFDHLVFALKYDGVDLALLKRLFMRLDAEAFAARIRAQPASKYSRRLFFFYELLTGRELPVGPLPTVQYAPALEPSDYYVSDGVRLPRYRVLDNLLGDARFCPIVRRTDLLREFADKGLDARASALAARTDPHLLARATWYLYAKETRSSFAIEREEPGTRMERFVGQLGRVETLELDTETGLTQLQNDIVHEQYRERGFRGSGDPEVYVGETIGFREKIHHVGARSSSTADMMGGLLELRAAQGTGGPVVDAACRSFGFVFIHPYGDGNGRIHRLLLHYVLARRKYLPPRLIVPISSVLLRQPARYDEVLETFSRRVLPYVEWKLSDEGELTIENDPDDLYRYPDLTATCEATFEWLERALEEDVAAELAFLRTFDEVRVRMRDIIEMPDKDEQLFIKLCLDNRGTLSKSKRKRFSKLDDETIAALEAIISEAMGRGLR